MSTDELAEAIGRVQLADVALEDDFRVLWEVLAGDGPARLLRPRDFGVLLRDCRNMLADVGLSPDSRKAAAELLVAAGEAHRCRNRLVHDVWIKDAGVDRWRSGVTARRKAILSRGSAREELPNAPAVRLDDFRACRLALQRMHWRVSALILLISEELNGRDGVSHLDDFDLETALVQDDFSMSEDGSMVTVPASN